MREIDQLDYTGVTQEDYFTLIGHAEYLRRVEGQADMPDYFFGLAARIAILLGDHEKARQAKEMHKRPS